MSIDDPGVERSLLDVAPICRNQCRGTGYVDAPENDPVIGCRRSHGNAHRHAIVKASAVKADCRLNRSLHEFASTSFLGHKSRPVAFR
jgi:hypothetical protein